jgi:NAD(P)-dependent dehydrogenase (short-subunit alcohol dehydrogenase family)
MSWRHSLIGAMAAWLGLFAAGDLAWSQASEPAKAATASTVLITGSNRGIGLELARQYAARGWRVIATCRKPEEATELKALAAASPNVTIEALDVSNFAAIDALAAKYAGTPIDVLMNNAGITGGPIPQFFGRMQWEVFEQVLRTNTIAPLKMAEAFIKHVEASSQKKIVSVSSSEGSIAAVSAARMYFYRSSKTALNMEMRNLSFQLKKRSVSVGMINPGPVATDMMKGVPMKLREIPDAAADIIRITDGLNLENTGSFWNYDGVVLGW